MVACSQSCYLLAMSVDLLANKLGMFREIDFRTSSSYFTNFPSWSNSISETFNIPLWKDAPRLWGEIVLRNSHNVVDTPCRTNARNLHMPKEETYLESLQSLRNIPFEGLGLLQKQLLTRYLEKLGNKSQNFEVLGFQPLVSGEICIPSWPPGWFRKPGNSWRHDAVDDAGCWPGFWKRLQFWSFISKEEKERLVLAELIRISFHSLRCYVYQHVDVDVFFCYCLCCPCCCFCFYSWS